MSPNRTVAVGYSTYFTGAGSEVLSYQTPTNQYSQTLFGGEDDGLRYV